MIEWSLSDCSQPIERGQVAPQVVIRADEQLRGELERLVQRQPRIALLRSPTQETLEIGIGGPFAGLRWLKPPSSKHLKMAVNKYPCCPQAVEFAAEGSVSGFRPQHLFPAQEVIDAVLHFYNHCRLPEWMDWLEWDAQANRMILRPATLTPAAS